MMIPFQSQFITTQHIKLGGGDDMLTLFCTNEYNTRMPCSHDYSTQAENQMQRRFFLDVVVGQCAAILELLPSKNQALLIWWDSFFVLDLSFYVVNSVRCLNIQRDRLTCERFHEDLHAATKTPM